MYWDYFDKAFCISLNERKDRQREARRQFAKVGLSEQVEFVFVRKHPSDCEQGIYESHMMCMEKGLKTGAKRILIFEDDVVFDGFRSEQLEQCVDFLARHPWWNLFFWGCMVKKSRRTNNRAVMEVEYQCLSHAYGVNRKFAETLVQIPWQGVPFDDLIRNLKPDHLYAACPALAFQSSSPSDNERFLALDRFRRLCGGLKRLQKMNELYHRHKMMIIAGHLVILGIIMGLWIA
ncbi:MAG: glycosyltransferase family 25 protein [Desulfatiglandaceae bacterium]